MYQKKHNDRLAEWPVYQYEASSPFDLASPVSYSA